MDADSRRDKMAPKDPQKVDPFEKAKIDKARREKRKERGHITKKPVSKDGADERRVKAKSSETATLTAEEQRIYFSPTEKVNFETIFHSRVLLKGKLVDFTFFNKESFAIGKWLKFQGWDKLLTKSQPTYPKLARLFYTHLRPDGSFYMDGATHQLSEEVIGQSLGIKWQEAELCSEDADKTKIFRELTGQNDIGADVAMIKVSSLSLDLKLLHHILIHSLLPRKGSRDAVTIEDGKLLWMIANKRKVSLPKHILEHMLWVKTRHNMALPYGMFLTFIFQHLGIAVDTDSRVELTHYDHVNETTLNRMGYSKPSGQEWVLRGKAADIMCKGKEVIEGTSGDAAVPNEDEAEVRGQGEASIPSNPTEDLLSLRTFLESQFSSINAKLACMDSRLQRLEECLLPRPSEER